MLDFFCLFVVVLSTFWGYLRGALWDLLSLFSLLAAYLGSAPLGQSLGGAIARRWGLAGGASYIVARLATGLAIYVSLTVAATIANRKFGKTETGVTRRWNRNLGAVLGLAFGLVTALILLFVADAAYKAFPDSHNVFLRTAGRSGFRRWVSPHNPADRFLVTDALKLMRAARRDPEVLDRLRADERIRAVLDHPAVQAVAQDEQLARAVQAGRFEQAFRNGNVRELLQHEELLEEMLSPEVRAAIQDAIAGREEDAPDRE